MKKRVHIIVLGDIGRSPRMKYHAWSFAQEGWEVRLSGFSGTRLHQLIEGNGSIELAYISHEPAWCGYLPKIISLPIKLVYLFVTLFFHLLFAPWSPVIMLQTPPAVPSLIVVWIVSRLRRSRLIIDWHNYGYTNMALSLKSKNHPITLLYKFLEVHFAKYFLQQDTTLHFCVSKGMKRDLLVSWNIKAKVLYDRPGPILRVPSIDQSHLLFVRMSHLYPHVFLPPDANLEEFTRTRFTTVENEGGAGEGARWIPNRPAIVVSSTSWTLDEDFSIFFDALDMYNVQAMKNTELPEVVVIVTGKGPQRSMYQAMISNKGWERVKVITPWLEAEDYPVMIGSADLGVCLHNSTSGFDLPMKIVDMFGLNVPTCAIDYPVLKELVSENVNGRLFITPEQLCNHMIYLLGTTNGRNDLKLYRENLKEFSAFGWHQNWKQSLLPRVENSLR